MPLDRRQFVLRSAAAVAAGAAAARSARAAEAASAPPAPSARNGYVPVTTPDGATLPFTLRDGVKVFHLKAEPVSHEFSPGLRGECWGYNGRVHGPTIEAVEEDRIRIYVTNRLPAPTTVHWHGLVLPNGMDGVAGVTQRAIEPGETFKYEFVLERPGTYMYHPHHDEMVQMAMGLMGMFVVHPKAPRRVVDRDFAIMLSEWAITPGTRRPDPNEMTDFNVLTFNARAYPGTSPLVVRRGDRVRIRFGNLSAMDHHPIHLHGGSFQVTETDGGEVPETARFPETTVLVPVGSTRVVEFTADRVGDWMLHCHMTHHLMNQMGHGVPNLVGLDPAVVDERLGVGLPAYAAATHGESDDPETLAIPPNSIPMMGASGPFGYITMGGMVTLLKVRDPGASAEPEGWFEHPAGTVADVASPEDLEADGIRP